MNFLTVYIHEDGPSRIISIPISEISVLEQDVMREMNIILKNGMSYTFFTTNYVFLPKIISELIKGRSVVIEGYENEHTAFDLSEHIEKTGFGEEDAFRILEAKWKTTIQLHDEKLEQQKAFNELF